MALAPPKAAVSPTVLAEARKHILENQGAEYANPASNKDVLSTGIVLLAILDHLVEEASFRGG